MTWQWTTIICCAMLSVCVLFVCMTAMSVATARQKAAEALSEAIKTNPGLAGLLGALLGKPASRPAKDIQEVRFDG